MLFLYPVFQRIEVQSHHYRSLAPDDSLPLLYCLPTPNRTIIFLVAEQNIGFVVTFFILYYLWPPASCSWPTAIMLYCCRFDLLSLVFFFSLPNLRGGLADRHQTLPHDQWWPRFIKFGQNENSHNFATWLRTSPESNKTSSIGKRLCKLRTLPRRQT